VAKLTVVGVAAALVAMLGGLWVVARASVSPEQRLADAAPPPAAVADAVLEERVLQDSVVIRGRVEVEYEMEIPAPTSPTEALPVVVELPVGVGGQASSGQVIAVVADRPVMVLEMAVPLWRSLHPGDEGSDVERLQRALGELGYRVVVDGEYGPVTQQAVRQWYRDAGFAAQEELLPADLPADAGGQVPQGEPEVPSPTGEGETGTDPGTAESGEPASEGAAAPAPAEPELGVVVPLGEVIGVADLPATVTDLPTPVGSQAVDGPVAVLSPSNHVVRAYVEPGRAELLTPGTAGVAEIDGVAESWPVEVVGSAPPEDGDSGMGDDPETGGADAAPDSEGAIVFAPTVPFGPDAVGKSVQVSVTLESTEVPVLAAPISAVRTDADGEYLQVAGDDGEPVRVPITPGRSIGGWVELVDPGDLEPGLTVILSR
jgi:peptidoglycan hydrolase-like protein with peptidoglycan-binding domain